MNSAAPIVMTGCQRSGTTLLAKLLKAHPQGAFGIEDGVIRFALQWFGWARDNRHLLPYARFNEFCGLFKLRPAATVSYARMEALLRTLQEDDAFLALTRAGETEQLIRTICWRYYHPDGDPRPRFWGDKYPEYLFQLEAIEAVFPKARYIFIKRQPEATVEALVRKLPANRSERLVGKHIYTVDDCARQWAVWNGQWLAFRERIPQERRLEVCYEAFIEAPEAGLDRLGRFVNADLAAAPAVRHLLTSIDHRRRDAWRQSPHYFAIASACRNEQVVAVARELGYGSGQ